MQSISYTPTKDFYKDLKSGDCYLEESVGNLKSFVLEKIDSSLFHEVIKSVKILHEFEYTFVKYQQMLHNYKEVFQLVEKYSNEFGFHPDPTFYPENLRRISFIDVNRAFINYLMSYRVFIEHTERRLKSKYQKSNPDKVQQINDVRKVVKKGDFIYTFMTLIRNYAAHDYHPIDKFYFELNYNDDVYQRRSAQIFFVKSKLLESREMKKNLGAELRLYPDEIPVNIITDKAQQLVEIIYKEAVLIELDLYRFHANRITKLYNKNIYGGSVSIRKHVNTSPNGKLQSSGTLLNIGIINDLIKVVNNIKPSI